ncbi:hypothetical protein Pmani_023655 [Petrolisthes manimaculis]|uniref:t-SNARE coiled-coil homology domain-containing protein n=1 Tax=Petrolisthes manimaculis TaxID=1843537 RepID=A0AAE1U0V4_9EUCA|nr:hypothetical protein Pmani_023655 [Petrolisthes manimaculis]
MSFFGPVTEDHWLVDYGATEGAVREVRETVQQRRQAGVRTVQHALLSNKLRTSIQQTKQRVEDLLERLEGWELRDLTRPEHERRTRLCEKLLSALTRAEMDFNERRYQPQGATEERLGGWRNADLEAGGGGGGGGGYDNDDTALLTNDQLRQQQTTMIREQDSGLEALSRIVSSQKHIARAINTEVDEHNVLIDDITNRTDNTRNRVEDETGNITTVNRKARTWRQY